MRRILQNLRVMFAVICCCVVLVGQQSPVRVTAADTPSLVISQLKITSSNGQFVTLYNATDTALDMSKYQLEYFNSYDLSKATSSKLIALSGVVPPHGYFMINDNAMLLCYQLTINSASLSFSSTSGILAVLSLDQTRPGGVVMPKVEDFVGWSKTPISGVQTLPSDTNSFLQRTPVDLFNNPDVNQPGNGDWQTVQPEPNDPCQLISKVGSTSTPAPTGLVKLLPASNEVPATILSVASSGKITPYIPASDIGLAPPSISELLPNPIGTGNDKTDEFIELYNPNNTSFDLSGFILQTGLTKTYNYTFPQGTKISGKSFLSVYSADSRLTLSNTSGQARLLDPFGGSLTSSSVYGSAKDGQAWANGKGKWYWTTSPSPGKPNIIKEPESSRKSKKSTGTVKGANTKKIASNIGANNGGFEEEPQSTPIHTGILVFVGCLALLYGAYEYRADIANRLHQLRRNFGFRRKNRT